MATEGRCFSPTTPILCSSLFLFKWPTSISLEGLSRYSLWSILLLYIQLVMRFSISLSPPPYIARWRCSTAFSAPRSLAPLNRPLRVTRVPPLRSRRTRGLLVLRRRRSPTQCARLVLSYPVNYLFKLLLIGDSGVGKSCFMVRFAEQARMKMMNEKDYDQSNTYWNNCGEGRKSTKIQDDVSKEESEMLDVWSNAVEVEHAGCSFNPEPESHKDVLARAVAYEMRKIYKNELGPKPIPLVAPGEIINEEDRYFLEADSGSEDNADDETPGDVDDTTTEKRSKTKRVTRVESNRRARRKVLQKAESESKKKVQLSKEIDSISDIMQEIVQEEEESKNRHLRRAVSKQERLKSCPPRLGKRKFEPAPVQVLLSEEISGSLRKLQGCCTLARDRFKSLEKRGLVVPSARKKSRV